MRAEEKSAIIFGTYINAYSIYKGLRKVGFDGTIYAVDTQKESKYNFIEKMAKDVKVIKKKLVSLNEVTELIKELQKGKAFIFFTNEECLDVVKDSIDQGVLDNIVAFTGSKISNELIVNKYNFYKFIQESNLAVVPKTITSNENPFDVLGNPFIIRPKNSWEGEIKTPRLSIISSVKQLKKVEEEYYSLGMNRDMWCYQELLSVEDRHNLSVCGWYGLNESNLIVTRKVIQHPPKTGCGDVVEVVEDYPHVLIEHTKNVLSALEYEGPFELEFVYDLKTNQYCIIELNPRYWMQHELAEKNMDYYLIRKNLEQTNVIPIINNKYKYWVNTNQFLYRLIKGNVSIFKYVKRAVMAPGFWESVKWARYYGK